MSLTAGCAAGCASPSAAVWGRLQCDPLVFIAFCKVEIPPPFKWSTGDRKHTVWRKERRSTERSKVIFDIFSYPLFFRFFQGISGEGEKMSECVK